MSSEEISKNSGSRVEAPADWSVLPLGELLASNGLSYGVVQPGQHVPSGIPILRVGNLKSGRISLTPVLRVDPDIERGYERTRLRGGEIALSVVGSVGEVALVSEQLAGWNVARAVAVVRLMDPELAPWVRYWLQGPFAQRLMHTWKTTTVQETLNLRDVRNLPIAIPPVSVRHLLVDLFEVLDGKIDANQRLIELCDLSWQAALQAETEIEALPLSQLASFINGRAFTKDASGTGRMVVRIAELNSGPGGSTVYNDIEVANEHLARPGDLLFAWSGSLTVQRWYRPEAIVNQHIFKVVPNPEVPMWLVHGAILQLLEFFRGIAAGKATTMGHIQRRDLESEVRLPASARVAAMDDWCGTLWSRALGAERENLTLIALRDSLLPGLLSGAVRVREAVDRVSEAV